MHFIWISSFEFGACDTKTRYQRNICMFYLRAYGYGMHNDGRLIVVALTLLKVDSGHWFLRFWIWFYFVFWWILFCSNLLHVLSVISWKLFQSDDRNAIKPLPCESCLRWVSAREGGMRCDGASCSSQQHLSGAPSRSQSQSGAIAAR